MFHKLFTIFAVTLLLFTAMPNARAHASEIISNSEASALLQKADKTDDEYEKLGEWWMEQMMGSQHEAMDQSIEAAHGEAFLRTMHIVMGKRLAEGGTWGMMPMMQMLTPYGPSQTNRTGMYPWKNNWPGMGWGMMQSSGWWSGFGAIATLSAFLWAIVFPLSLTALAVLFIVRIWKQIKKS